jgi:hypothetical protein
LAYEPLPHSSVSTTAVTLATISSASPFKGGSRIHTKLLARPAELDPPGDFESATGVPGVPVRPWLGPSLG